MKIFISSNKFNLITKKWYEGYIGLMLGGNKVLGISISDKYVVISHNPMVNKRSVDLYIYIPFYCIVIDIIDPWKK